MGLISGLATLRLVLEPRPRATAKEEIYPPVQVEARGVHLRLANDLGLDIHRMRAEMVGATAAQPPVFDDPSSFVLRVASGQAALSARSLTTLINAYLSAHSNARARHVVVTTAGRMLRLKGRLGDGRDSRFTVTLRPRMASDGRVVLQAADDLVDLLGSTLDAAERHGITVTRHAVLLSLRGALPPPLIEGRVDDVRVEKGALVLTYADRLSDAGIAPAPAKGNYLHLRHGVLRIGKLTMHGADVQLIDRDPSDGFDFSSSEYARQLAAARSEITAAHGLRAYVPDFSSLYDE